MHSYERTADQYDATVGAIGFDRVRVKYRQQRREIIRYIVTNKLYGSQLNEYITSEIVKFTDPEDQKQLVSDIHEDLEQLGPHNIAGMGFTIEEVQEWRKGK